MRIAALLSFLLLAPVLSHAQASFPTTFPADAKALAPDELKKRLTDKVFTFKITSGPETRLQYKADFAYFNVGNSSDSGPWRVEGSKLCTDWKRIGTTCSEIRVSGNTLYAVRSSNGEVAPMVEK